MQWPPQIDSVFPTAPHPKEPSSLRDDIADELADHLAFATARERLRGAESEEAARAAALEKFGNPAHVARRIWWVWMRETIMKERLLWATVTLLVLAVIGLFGLSWVQMKENRAMNQTLQDTMEKMAKLQHVASIPSDMGTASIKVVKKTKDGEPAAGIKLSLNGKPFAEDKTGREDALKLETDKNGYAQFGPVRPGKYVLHVNADLIGVSKIITLYAGRDTQFSFILPAVTPVSVTLQPQWPEGLKSAGLATNVSIEGEIKSADGWGVNYDLFMHPDGSMTEDGKEVMKTLTLPAMDYSVTVNGAGLPKELSKPKSLREKNTFVWERWWVEMPKTEKKTITYSASGKSAEWKLEIPKMLIKETELALEDARRMPEDVVLPVGPLASSLPDGHVTRVVPVLQKISFWYPSNKHSSEDKIIVSSGGHRIGLDWGNIPEEQKKNPNTQYYLMLEGTDNFLNQQTTSSSLRLQTFEIKEAWQATSVTWATQPVTNPVPSAVPPPVIGSLAYENPNAAAHWYRFDVTSLIREQNASGRDSFGAVLRFNRERNIVAPSAETTLNGIPQTSTRGKWAILVQQWILEDRGRRGDGGRVVCSPPVLVCMEPEACET